MKMTGKIAVGALAGAVTVILVWVSKTFVGIEIPTEVAGAVQVITTAVIQFVTPDEMES